MASGDSYSSVLTAYFRGRRDIRPSATLPLGVPFPGEMGGLWNEPDAPNWVGHLITKHCPLPRYKPDQDSDPEFVANPLLAYDYAIGGNTVSGVQTQVGAFLDGAGAKPDWAPWSGRDSLFVTWVGINDCASVGVTLQSRLCCSFARSQLLEGSQRQCQDSL